MRLIATCHAVFAVLLMACGGGGGPASPETPPFVAGVAFTAKPDLSGPRSLYVSDVVTGVTRNLTAGYEPELDVYSFTWSPDKTRLAFAANAGSTIGGDLYVSDLEGPPILVSGPKVPGGSVAFFQWSPDSSLLAYRADQETDGVLEVFVVPAVGGVTSRRSAVLVAGRAFPGFAWSPDSTMLAYVVDQDVAGDRELYVVSALAGPAVKVSPPMIAGGDVWGFVWVPGTASLVYLADAEVDGRNELYVVPAAGGASVKISDELSGPFHVSEWFISPDGASVAFLDSAGLFTVPSLGGTPAQIPVAWPTAFSWSPNGTRLCITAPSDTAGIDELYVVPAAGGQPVKVSGPMVPGGKVITYSKLQDPEWSPDGTRIAYAADQEIDEVPEMFVAMADGSGAMRVSLPMVAGGGVRMDSGIHAGERAFAWSPDGTRLLYRADMLVDGRYELFTVLPDGTGTVALLGTNVPVNRDVQEIFGWTSDGSAVVFVSDLDVNNIDELHSVHPDGTHLLTLSGPSVPGGSLQSYVTR